MAAVDPSVFPSRLRALEASTLLGNCAWDQHGVIVDANAAFLAMADRSLADLAEGRLSIALFDPPPGVAKAADSTQLLECALRRADGSQLPVMLGVAPSDSHDTQVAAFVVDVTEQRRNVEFEQLLLAIVSHDLRNPLGVVSMATAMLKTHPLGAEQSKVIKRLDSAARRCVRLVSDLLDYTTARGAGIRLHCVEIDLHPLIDQVVEELRAAWPGRAIAHVKVGSGFLQGDADRMAQVITNLIANALQHSPADSPVRVETLCEGDAIVLKVENGGRPIPAEFMPHLFAPLRRGHSAGYQPGSLGLGLFIVEHLVQGHGGTITVTSDESDGTRFTVRLPLSQRSGD